MINNNKYNDLYQEIKKLRYENFKLINDSKDFKYTIQNYKKIIYDLNKKISQSINKNNISNSNNSDSNKSDSDNEIRRIDYKDIPKLGIHNLISLLVELGYNIKDIETKSKHELKQIYNRYYCNKLKRKLM